MKHVVFFTCLVFGMLIAQGLLASNTMTISGTLTGLDGNRPVVMYFMTEQEWIDEATVPANRTLRFRSSNGSLSYSIQLPAAVYCIFVFEDYDRSGELTQNFFRVPQENFGFSQNFNPLANMRKPRFSDIRIPVQPNARVNIRLIDR